MPLTLFQLATGEEEASQSQAEPMTIVMGEGDEKAIGEIAIHDQVSAMIASLLGVSSSAVLFRGLEMIRPMASQLSAVDGSLFVIAAACASDNYLVVHAAAKLLDSVGKTDYTVRRSALVLLTLVQDSAITNGILGLLIDALCKFPEHAHEAEVRESEYAEVQPSSHPRL